MANVAVYNMEELSTIDLPYLQQVAKNLFVRDDKRRRYYFIVVKGEKRIDLKQFRLKNQLRPLSFASVDDLQKILGLEPGSVTPLGIFNDKNHQVHCFLDQDFLDEPAIIGVHPYDNTTTLWLNTQDFIQIIQKLNNPIDIIEM